MRQGRESVGEAAAAAAQRLYKGVPEMRGRWRREADPATKPRGKVSSASIKGQKRKKVYPQSLAILALYDY